MTATASFFFQSRTAFVLDALSRVQAEPGTKRILDIGFIGDDYAKPFLHYAIRDSLAEGDVLIGLDNDEEGMKRFQASDEQAHVPTKVRTEYRCVSLYESGLAPESFDAILLCEVLEHLPEPFGAIAELTKLLKPGGQLILTYPNPLSIPLFLRYLRQKDLFETTFLDTFRGSHEHRVFPHPASLAVTLRAMGYPQGHAAFIKIHGGPALRFLAQHSAAVRKFGSYAGIRATKGTAVAA